MKKQDLIKQIEELVIGGKDIQSLSVYAGSDKTRVSVDYIIEESTSAQSAELVETGDSLEKEVNDAIQAANASVEAISNATIEPTPIQDTPVAVPADPVAITPTPVEPAPAPVQEVPVATPEVPVAPVATPADQSTKEAADLDMFGDLFES